MPTTVTIGSHRMAGWRPGICLWFIEDYVTGGSMESDVDDAAGGGINKVLIMVFEIQLD